MAKKSDSNQAPAVDSGGLPSVDIILPMFNEELVVINTINNLLQITYGNYNIIAIDDGSTDDTLQIVNTHFRNHPKVKIIHQENKGKGYALNNAINCSKGEILICIDADTIVRPDMIDKFLPWFTNKRVAAVTGYLKVGNRNNLLTNSNYQFFRIISNPSMIRDASSF